MIFVEKATEKELQAIQTIDSLVLGNSSRKDFLANAVRAGQCLAARIGDTIVGVGRLNQTFYGQGFISLLTVHPDYRRRGVATALIRHVESICPTEKLFTSTNESNVIAQRVYESLGFTRSGHIENLDEGDPEIVYFKRLGSDRAASG
jgi:ribosomal protein S18 acetylase RimI-like enzyme